jgi:acyl-CoA thioesterase
VRRFESCRGHVTSEFDAATAVDPLGNGAYRGAIDRDWWIDKGPNGGFVASIILRALTQEVNDEARAPRSLTVHYVARPAEGEIQIKTSIERVGRSMTATTARLIQNDRLLATAQCAFSTPREGPAFDDSPAPEAPAPEDVPVIEVPKDMLPRFAWNFDYRWTIGNIPYSSSEVAFTGGWIRPKDQRPIDPLLITTYADGWSPAIFTKLSRPAPVPTIDLSVHFRAPTVVTMPADWVLVRFETKVAAGGFIEEDGYIWDRGGTLLAQSRQLALFQTSKG